MISLTSTNQNSTREENRRDPKANTIFCITGMHRSGTSLTTSWLEMCGLPVHDGSFHGPGVGNPKGHFEDKEFVDLQADAIKSYFPDSRGWKVFSEKKISLSDQALDHAKELIDRRNGRFSLWGWKDPRSVLFLEDWKRMIPELKVLLIWRPCSEVVRSLVNRSQKATLDVFKISTFEAARLWKVYNYRALEFKRKYSADTLLIPLAAILKKDKEVLSKISQLGQVQLEYQPIKSIFDETLLKKPASSLFIKTVCRLYNAKNVEKNLMLFSDSSLH